MIERAVFRARNVRRAIILEAAKLEMMPEAELRAALEREAAVNASILSEREG
ncbi:hypothetical protein JDN40_01625 [Rhodomicrobium vannielii ATCC 17100]|uniref:hypothetical protein n=1 Tax=Rhodomicrobium vannielii TaxID=1069 RepID=UPI00191B3057|nr:hypothetical protein [Rhodomicrobium vannielii]MBJ7532817.1 hypothetical protein [Rhodomicrobium vannielii ATCC 17100]